MTVPAATAARNITNRMAWRRVQSLTSGSILLSGRALRPPGIGHARYSSQFLADLYHLAGAFLGQSERSLHSDFGFRPGLRIVIYRDSALGGKVLPGRVHLIGGGRCKGDRCLVGQKWI